MVAEGNYLVYMYENAVQSSLNLRSEQRFYFISPHLLSSSVLYQLLQQVMGPVIALEVKWLRVKLRVLACSQF
jgi:hypothetical protein